MRFGQHEKKAAARPLPADISFPPELPVGTTRGRRKRPYREKCDEVVENGYAGFIFENPETRADASAG